jgi:hypothetical protein
LEKNYKNVKKVLLGTQADIRDWFSKEKKSVRNKVMEQVSGVDLFGLLPIGNVLLVYV